MLTRSLENKKTFLSFVGFLVLLVIIPPFLPTYVVELLTQTFIWAIVAVSLDILLGYTGLPSLGHTSYMGLGAYSTAILMTRYQSTFPEALILSIVFSAIMAAIFGLLALRAKGHYFLLITMALAMVIWGLAYRWVSFTGGDNGIGGIVRPSLGLSWSLKNTIYFYYFTFIFFVAALTLMFMIIQSPFGKTLLGIRESESRMRSLGYNVWLHKYLAFIITGTFSGFAGVLWAFYNKFVSPVDVDILYSMEALLMVGLGGPGTFFGPIVGAGIIVFLKNLASVYVKRWMMFMSFIFILTVFYTPDGIFRLFKRAFERGPKK